jgi:serine/threonine-protein kinase RsbW
VTIAQRLGTEERVYVHELSVELPKVASWRAWAAGVVHAWGAPGAVVDAVALGVSELLGNVHKHANDPRCRLELRLAVGGFAASVRLAVHDRSRVLPTVPDPDWVRDCGRGLWLLRETADDFGFERTAYGKQVWMRCAFDTARHQEETP